MKSSGGPLQHAAFRWLLVGTTVNSLGNMIAPVAIAFAVLDLGGSPTQLGLVVGTYALADVVAVLWGGVLGDRLPRTVMMRGSNAAAALVQGLVALSLLTDHGSLWLLAVGGALNGALGSLAGPSTQAVTPQTVPALHLRRAIALRRLSQNARATPPASRTMSVIAITMSRRTLERPSDGTREGGSRRPQRHRCAGV